MNKNHVSVFIVCSGILISGVILGIAHAQDAAQDQPPQAQEQRQPDDIRFPVKELGNCTSKEACKTFCDSPENSDACFAFAKQHNLMSSEELDHAKKFRDGGMVGPGGCKGQASCDQYCGNADHMEECIAFAQKNGMMSSQQLQESQKVLTAIKKGVKPPACGGPKQCDAYCGSPEHMEECVNFSLAAGLMPDNQKEQMQKTLAAIKRGVKPPACRGPQECDAYCGSPEHMEECMNFAVETGMMPDNQKAQMQKTLSALKQGIKPPACQPNRSPSQQGQQSGPNEGQGFNPGSGENGNGPGRGEGGLNRQFDQQRNGLPSCDQYCGEDSHVEECVKFSVAVGNMTEQQAQVSIKTRGKGPGGCVGREACDAFCGNPDNQETCFNFGKENGMIPPEDLQRMQEGQQKMKDSFGQMPPEVLTCLTTSLGTDVVEKVKSGAMVPSRNIGESIGQCFRQGMQNQPGPGGPGGQETMSGDLKACIQSHVGNDGLSRIESGGVDDSAFMEKVQPCFEQFGQPGQPGQPEQQGQFGGPDRGQFDQGQQGQFNQQGQNRFQNDLNCSPKGTAAAFVCAKNGRNASGGSETTYFNACTAKQDGAEIIHEGVCEGQKPCADVANPVCGNDGHTWVSACYAEEQGGGVKHEGVCEGPSNQQNQNQQGPSGNNFQPGPGAINPGGQRMPQQAGPGGCKGPEECQKYCTANPEVCKNFQPPQNQQGQRGQGGQGQGGPNQGQGFNPGSGQNGNGFGRGQFGGQQGQQNQPGQGQQGQFGGPPDQSGQGGFNQGQFGGGPGQFGQPGQMQQGQQQMRQQFNQGQPGQPGQYNPINELRSLNEFNPTGQPGQPGQSQPGQFSPPAEMQPQQQSQPPQPSQPPQ